MMVIGTEDMGSMEEQSVLFNLAFRFAKCRQLLWRGGKMRRSILVLLMATFIAAGTASADLSTGLVARYDFDGNANDLSGYGNDGTVHGATLTVDRFGNANSAYYFDGVDDSIAVANTNGVFDLTASWTLAAWVRPSNAGIDPREDPIIWKSANDALNQDTFKLGWGDSSAPDTSVYLFGLERASDDADLMVYSSPHVPTQWHHVVVILLPRQK